MNVPFVLVATWLPVINLATFGAFWIDKRAAIRGDWRISEWTLLQMVIVGGGFGAVLGQVLLRHKTRKEPFRTQLHFILGLQLAGLIALAVIHWL